MTASAGRLREVNLELGKPTVNAAVKRLTFELHHSRSLGCAALKIIHGYGSSGTGGRIRVDRLDGVEVSFTGIFNTLVVRHQDVAGELSRILNELSVSGVNIANMSLNRDRRGGAALTVVETDQKIPADALERIQALYGVLGATYYEKEED